MLLWLNFSAVFSTSHSLTFKKELLKFEMKHMYNILIMNILHLKFKNMIVKIEVNIFLPKWAIKYKHFENTDIYKWNISLVI
jgi:hypothetical protein